MNVRLALGLIGLMIGITFVYLEVFWIGVPLMVLFYFININPYIFPRED